VPVTLVAYSELALQLLERGNASPPSTASPQLLSAMCWWPSQR